MAGLVLDYLVQDKHHIRTASRKRRFTHFFLPIPVMDEQVAVLTKGIGDIVVNKLEYNIVLRCRRRRTDAAHILMNVYGQVRYRH
jgi:hypothetical protein